MTVSTFAILANIPAHPSAGESINFILVGFLFVTIVLLILAGVTSLIGLVFKGAAKPKSPPLATAPADAKPVAASVEPTVQPVAGSTESEPPMDEEEAGRIAAVVAAAVHCVIGARPHRIVSIRPIQGTWAQEGRRSIFSSHTIRR